MMVELAAGKERAYVLWKAYRLSLTLILHGV